MTRRSHEEKTLTRSEMEIMNILWNNGKSMSTHGILENYPEPKPAYSTIATFMKILTKKGFVSYKKAEAGSKTFFFYPLLTRQKYMLQFMQEAKSTLFGNSMKSMLHFFVQSEEITDEDLEELIRMIRK